MNIVAISRFNRLSDNQRIRVPEGMYQHHGHIVYTFPEYTGEKTGMYDYYKAISDTHNWHSSVLNGMLHQLISSIVIS